MSVEGDLRSLLEGEVSVDEATLNEHSRDASLFYVKPELVVFPRTTKDIQELVRYTASHAKQGLSLTVRSGGTCMSGGPLNESIIVDVNKHLRAIRRVGNHEATVEPGVFYRDFEQATLKHNLLMPSYPASRDICTVGGMVNNNAGGEKTLMYGKTAKFIKRLKVVLRDGGEYVFARLSRSELEEKKKLGTFEGDLYRQMFDMLEHNYSLIQKARPNVSKNSTGYNLWDVWDRHSFDFTQLLAGSQGTLGITTEIAFRLITPKPHAQMLVIFLRDTAYLADVVKHVMRYYPESFESYDDHTLKIALRGLPHMMKQMGTANLFTLLLSFRPEMQLIASGGLPKLILLAEFTGKRLAEIEQRAKAAQAGLHALGLKTRLARSAAEVKKYWTIRRESFNLLRRGMGDMRTAPFIDDIVVDVNLLPVFLPRLDQILAEYNITYTIAGHVGDGNFHIIPLLNLKYEEQRAIIPELAKKVYELVFSFDGSMSGEHNDGLIRSPFLKEMYGDKIYDLFVQTKNIFDPASIFNPGKKVGASWDYAMQHIIRE